MEKPKYKRPDTPDTISMNLLFIDSFCATCFPALFNFPPRIYWGMNVCAHTRQFMSKRANESERENKEKKQDERASIITGREKLKRVTFSNVKLIRIGTRPTPHYLMY